MIEIRKVPAPKLIQPFFDTRLVEVPRIATQETTLTWGNLLKVAKHRCQYDRILTRHAERCLRFASVGENPGIQRHNLSCPYQALDRVFQTILFLIGAFRQGGDEGSGLLVNPAVLPRPPKLRNLVLYLIPQSVPGFRLQREGLMWFSQRKRRNN